tara:strand:- start:101 stop:526 length:426 start_codon:yes stop_codon:yes gene_type:complete
MIFKVIVQTLIFVILAVLGFFLYRYARHPNRSIFDFTAARDDDIPGDPTVEDTVEDKEYSKKIVCEFEGEDIFDKKIYSRKGKLITEQPNMTCDKCDDYVFREEAGECYDYHFNKEYNEADYSVPTTGVCTAKLTAKACPF